MQKLKERILKDGQVAGAETVKVDSFLNHQIDVELLSEIGKEFAKRYADRGINKILTIEASGIAIACAVAWHMGCIPVVFAKKIMPNSTTDGFYSTEITSFTKRCVSTIAISKEYLAKGDNLLIVDDFLAHGEAACGLVRLAERAGAVVSGIGAAIEKEFQGGSRRLRAKNHRVESIVVIASIQNGHITFKTKSELKGEGEK